MAGADEPHAVKALFDARQQPVVGASDQISGVLVEIGEAFKVSFAFMALL